MNEDFSLGKMSADARLTATFNLKIFSHAPSARTSMYSSPM